MSYRNYLLRKGLTLLELVVVMVILVALAGILVPMLPGMLGKAHSSSHATNVAELNKVWELFNATNRHYPDYLDSLISGTGLYNKVQTPTPSPYSAKTLTELAEDTNFGTSGPDAAELVERLNEAGITNVYGMDNTTDNATFEPYGTGVTNPTATPIVAGTSLCQVSAAEVNAKLNGSLDGVYVLFGVGGRCTAVGRGGMTEAPVHFSSHGGDAGDPTKTYARYGVVFNVKQDPPVFVGAVAFHDDGLSGGAAAVQEYYSGHTHH